MQHGLNLLNENHLQKKYSDLDARAANACEAARRTPRARMGSRTVPDMKVGIGSSISSPRSSASPRRSLSWSRRKSKIEVPTHGVEFNTRSDREVGITVHERLGSGVVIADLKDGGLGAASGLNVGEVILSVNSKDVTFSLCIPLHCGLSRGSNPARCIHTPATVARCVQVVRSFHVADHLLHRRFRRPRKLHERWPTRGPQ